MRQLNKYNAEGYYDPTTYEALSKVSEGEKNTPKLSDFRTFDGYRPLVYICSPYAGDVHLNTKRARKYSRFALKQNTIPLAPYLLYPQFMNIKDAGEQRLARHKISYVLVSKCDELWVFGSSISAEMECAISVAEKRKMKIRYFTDDLKETK